VSTNLLGDFLFIGEISLDGSLRPVAGVLPIATTAEKMGITGLVVPLDNVREAAVVQGIDVYGCKHLSEVIKLLNNPQSSQPVKIDGDELNYQQQGAQMLNDGADLRDVKGQSPRSSCFRNSCYWQYLRQFRRMKKRGQM